MNPPANALAYQVKQPHATKPSYHIAPPRPTSQVNPPTNSTLISPGIPTEIRSLINTHNNPPTVLLSKNKLETPHCLVQLEKLRDVVNKHLGPCKICKLKGLKLSSIQQLGFVTQMEIVCAICNGRIERRIEMLETCRLNWQTCH